MSKVRLTGSNSGYVEIAAAADAGNLSFTMPTHGTALLGNGNNEYTGITTFNNDVKFDGATAGYDVVWDRSDNQLEFADNAKISLGSGGDMQLYHNGNHSNIKNSTGRLYILADDIWIKDGNDGDIHARFLHDDASELYFDGGKKLETTNTGVTVTGIVAATSFSGSGENLTRTTPYSHRNIIINGKADVFQRVLGGSQISCNAGSNFYCMDRWYARGESSLGVFSLIQQDISSEGIGAPHAIRVNVTTNVTPASGDVYKIAQRIEGKNIGHLSFGTSGARTITLSFLVKSSVTGTHGGSLMNSAQNRSFPFTYTISNPDTWEQKSITIPGDTGGTWLINTGIGLELNFDMGSGSAKRGTAGGAWIAARAEGANGTVQLISTSNANWYVTKVQIEEGSTATPFEHRSYGDELRRCQRYFFNIHGSNGYRTGITCYANSSSACRGVVYFPAPMRINPNFTGSATAMVFDSADDSATFNVNTISTAAANTNALYNRAFLEVSTSSMTGGQAGQLEFRATGFMNFSAEL